MPTALVTGGSRGLGEAYARELAERGYSIVLVARDADRLADAAERIGRATGAIVETLAADLTDPAGLAAVERRVTDPAVPVELLVNHAGAGTGPVVAGASSDALTAGVEPAVEAVLRLTRAALPVMTARGHGGVLNVAGLAGYLPSGGHARAAAQSWVLAFTDGVAASLRGTGVTVTAVVTGRIRGPHEPGGPFRPAPETVVRRSLDDLARGRTRSAPGWACRALVGYLEAPRTVLRLAARVTGRGRERPARPGEGPAATGPTRPSPVPTPFRDAHLPVRALPPGAGSLPALPELPACPAHVPAERLPAPRISGTGPLPVVTPARPHGRAGVRRLPAPPRPVQPPARDARTVRLAAG
ncbi:SDR family NAD(P)-dependent oxidoreductase [Pseudonocardia sp. C8]|uniref:SDR family NAD(P)-dependent oxidoreductase n=1 Tax=Pseudonocardia sp. C8 TaxID=2762759 RepID=UPI00164330CE|nr:SDR family NAD(P)-dependent oxidoreductase [Pseudonocardia sp. C8]MBC3191206.1 SDR family NAD(P)-dependent oxidoreductase [Pseudonocardia sp. C8]